MVATALVHLGECGEVDADELDLALDAVRRAGVEAVHGLFVVDTRRYGEPALSSDKLAVDRLEDAGHELLARFGDLASTRGLEVETRCCHGAPHEELAARAADLAPEVVVVVGPRPPHRTRTALDDAADEVVYVRAPLVSGR